MPNTLHELKHNIFEGINRITPDLLEIVVENTVRRIHLCLNNNGEHLKDIIFSFISYVTHFYSCISCRVINVQNGEVTFTPPCIC